MTARLTQDARDAIKGYSWYAPKITIAGYVRHYYGDQPWGGDKCGCADDRCIGYHHDETDECGCLEAWIETYVREARLIAPRCAVDGCPGEPICDEQLCAEHVDIAIRTLAGDLVFALSDGAS